jgi:hypothetical protein
MGRRNRETPRVVQGPRILYPCLPGRQGCGNVNGSEAIIPLIRLVSVNRKPGGALIFLADRSSPIDTDGRRADSESAPGGSPGGAPRIGRPRHR